VDSWRRDTACKLDGALFDDVVTSLESGRAQLERDNVTLQEDQIVMRELTFDLHNYVQFGQVLDERLATKIESDTTLTEDRRKFLQEEVL